MSTTADIYSHLDFSSKVSVGNAIGGLFGGNPFSGTDNTPKEEILQGGNDIVSDELPEGELDEYDTGNTVILTTTENTPQKGQIHVEISEQDYADYLKLKNQLSNKSVQV